MRTTHGRRGFSLTELLVTMVLLGAFAAAASRLFMGSVDLTRRSQAAQQAFGQVDYAVALLRQDVWNARTCRAADAQQLVIEQAGGRTIRWRYQPAGADGPAAWWRTASGSTGAGGVPTADESARLPWAADAPRLTFTTDSAGVVLHLNGHGPAPGSAAPALAPAPAPGGASQLRLVSQVQLAREVGR